MISRCDSAAMVPNTSDDLPDPETPVNTVSRRLGISTLTSFRLFSRAPWTRIRSWLSLPDARSAALGLRRDEACGVPALPGDGVHGITSFRILASRSTSFPPIIFQP